MRVLGISAFYHDSAAALIEDGHLVGAAQEERFTRKKHDAAFPEKAVQYCLDTAGIKMADVDYVAFYDKPFLKFERLLETYLAFAPRGFNSFRMAMPLWLKEKLFQKTLLRDEMKKWEPDFDWQKRLLFGEHHQSHAASAFFPSPYEEAAVLCMDGIHVFALRNAASLVVVPNLLRSADVQYLQPIPCLTARSSACSCDSSRTDSCWQRTTSTSSL